MRILIMGTGPFAVPTFREILGSSHEVVALVTRPVRPPRGKRKPPVEPMREVAEEVGLAVEAPEDVNSEEARAMLAKFSPDLFFVCDYGQILSNDALALARLGGINLHGSLLPKYRGAAPINWAIYNGETEMGVTLIHMTPALDGGPMLVRRSISIPLDQDAVEVEERLSALGVEATLEAIQMLEDWDGTSLMGERQDKKLVTKAPRLKKQDGQIDWSKPARDIVNQVRAFKPWPGSFTAYKDSAGKDHRLILDEVTLGEEEKECLDDCCAGQVLIADGRLIIGTGKEFLSIDIIQPVGKKKMPIADYLRGHPIPIGTHFE